MKSLEDVKKVKYIHFTTRGRRTGKPHMVELWFALGGGKVFLSHEGKQTDWIKNLEKDASISAEIGGFNFKGKAKVAVEGSSSRELGKKALYEKYYSKASQDVIDDWFSLSTVVEVTPST